MHRNVERESEPRLTPLLNSSGHLRKRWRQPWSVRWRPNRRRNRAIVTETSSLPVEEPDRWRSLPWKLLPAVARPPLLNMALDEVLVERVGARRRCAFGVGAHPA